jgi:hypothetical protein
VLAWQLNDTLRGGSRGLYHRRRTITTPDLRGLALSSRVHRRYVAPFTSVPRRGCPRCSQTYRPPTPPIPSVRRPISFAVPSQLESQPSLTRPYRMVSFFLCLLPSAAGGPLCTRHLSDLPRPPVYYHAGFVSDASSLLGTIPLFVRKHPSTTLRDCPT